MGNALGHSPHILSHLVDSCKQGGQKLVVGQLIHLLALFEDHAPAVASGDADVGLPGFTGAVDHAAHDRHGDGLLAVTQGLVHLIDQSDQIDAGASAGGTGDDVDALFPQARGLQDVLGGVDLLHGIVGQGDADGVADAVEEQSTDRT